MQPPGHPAYRFDPQPDLVLDRKAPLPGHANGMAFSALDADGRLLLRRIYYSIGGGFVVSEEELQLLQSRTKPLVEKGVPYPFANASQMLAMAAESGLSIAEMKRANEETHRAGRSSTPGSTTSGRRCAAASSAACRRTASCPAG